MKIAFVVDDTLDKPDGVQQYILTLGRWLTTLGHEVHYLCGQTRRTDIKHVHSLTKNTHVRFNGNRLSVPRPASAKKIKQLLADERFDVLHIQMPYSPLLAGKIIKYAPKTTVIIGTFHIVPYSWRVKTASRFLHVAVRGSLKRFDTIISVSEPAARFARTVFHRKSVILPNVVDMRALEQCTPLAKLDDGKLNIVFLGRLVERKGSLQLLQALEILHKQQQLHNVRVTICGKGPLAPKIEAYIHANHLSAHVHLAGFISEDEKGSYLASADIAVFPSTGGESFGIVLIEAMAAGSGVVLGGDNSGYRSVLSERKNQLFDPNDIPLFAKTLKHFIADGRARKSAHLWQKRAIQQYDVRTVGPQIVKIYQAAIAKKQA